MTFRSSVTLALLISVCAVSLPLPVAAATGDVLAVRVLENGWQAEVDIEGGVPGGTYAFGLGTYNDPTTAKLTLTVTSEGYDANGDPTTRTRTVYGTTFIRQVYPNQNLKDERVAGGVLTIKVALSDMVYRDDKAGGVGTSGTDVVATVAPGLYRNPNAGATSLGASLTATNGSTVTYPKVIGRFAWPGFERVGSSIPVEAVALQKFAQDGKPVAAVRYEAADQHGNTVTQTVRQMIVSTRGTDAHPVQVYRGDLSTLSLTQGDLVTVNLRAYPWIGDEDAVLDSAIGEDGVAQPHTDLGPLTFVNDREGTYGVGYALVSNAAPAVGGVVRASQAAAETAGAATGFQSIAKAAEAIKAYQTTNFGRASAGGGEILLAEGTHIVSPVTVADLGNMDTWLVVKRASNAQRELTTIAGPSGKTFPAQKVKYEGVTFSTANTGVLKGRSATDLLWIHDSDLSIPSTGGIAGYKYAYLTQNQFTNLYSKMFASIATPLVRGNNAPQHTRASLYAFLGNAGMTPVYSETGNATNLGTTENGILAYNSLYGMTASIGSFIGKTTVTHGFAVVGNVFENVSGNNPVIQIAADGSSSVANHVLVWRNTFVGQRSNLGYNDNGTTGWPRVNWSSKFNIFESWNNKDDTFTPPNAARIGAWPVGHNVGSVGNVMEHTTFRGEFDGLHTPYGIRTLNYVHDASFEGDRTGSGDYRLTEGSIAIDRAPGFSAVLPFDLLGNPVGAVSEAGAYEFLSGPPPVDVTAPEVTVQSPSGELPVGTVSAMLTVSTNENAACTYLPAGTALSSSDSRTHTLLLTGLANGQSYSGTVSCTDAATNTGTAPVSFSVAAPVADTTPPTVSITGPTSSLPAGTTSTTLSATTDETASCAYSTDAGATYGAMTPFSSTNATTHTTGLTGLSNGGNYTYYVRCKDAADNVSTAASISFSVATPPVDTTAPVVTVQSPSGELPSTTTSTTLAATTNESATCTYLPAGTALTSANGLSHSVALSGLTSGQSYSGTVSCVDAAGNTGTAPVSFSVAVASSTPTPVLKLTFDGATLTESSVSDTSGNGYTGTLVGAPVRVAGVVGDALEFNGSNYVDLGNSSFGLGDSFSMSMRVKRLGDNPAITFESMLARGAYLYPYAITVGGDGSLRIGTRTTGTHYIATTQKITTGSWAHVVFVYAQGTRSVYINGTLAKTDTIVGTPSWSGTNYKTYLGKSMLAGAEGFIGAIDDLRIYNQALTASDVSAIQAAP